MHAIVNKLLPAKHKISNETLYGYLMASPAIIGFFLFILGPLLASLVLSFTDYSVTNKFQFIGLDNYIKLFSGKDVFFYKSLGVTFYYVLLAVPISLTAAFMLALLLKPKIKGRSLFRVIFYIPCIIPAIATSTIFVWLLNPDIGLFNQILRALHLPVSKFIYSEQTVVPTLALMNIWTIGSTMLIFLASLEAIPDQYYEAVDVDGGNALHKLLHITLPMMTPTIFFNLVIGIINGFQTFTQAFIMTNGGPNNSSLFYSVYLYREAFTNQRMAGACALAWVLFVIIMLLSLLVFRSSNLWVHYEGDR
jgi:multiple sugar transport system permease protein